MSDPKVVGTGARQNSSLNKNEYQTDEIGESGGQEYVTERSHLEGVLFRCVSSHLVYIKLFLPKYTLSFSPENIKLLMFSGVRERVHLERMGKGIYAS